MGGSKETMIGRGTIKGSAALALVAVIWGVGYVQMRSGASFLGPFIFNGLRYALGCLSLTPVMGFLYYRERQGAAPDDGGPGSCEDNRVYLRGGLLAGLILYLGMSVSQIGLIFTTASKAGFLTAMYIVLVPIVGLFLKKKSHWNTWVSVAIGGVGLYFLSITGNFVFAPGDAIVLTSSLFWSVHVYVIDYYVNRTDILKFMFVQFALCSLLSFITSPFLDRAFISGAVFQGLLEAVPHLLFLGILSSGLAFCLQGYGQRRVPPSAAALIMSFEAVFGMLCGVLVLGETMTPRELFGCFLMFCAVLLAQLPAKKQ